jgi:hypothetical protein
MVPRMEGETIDDRHFDNAPRFFLENLQDG